MRRLIAWFRANKLTLNLGKTVCVLFQKKGPRQMITLEVDGVQIKSVKEFKFLGMWLDEYLNWCTHVQKLTLKMTRNLNLLKYSQNLMPAETKKLIYHAHIGSHLQYGLILWGNGITNEQLNKIQKLQNLCILYISGSKTNSASGNRELGILTVKDMIHLANLKFGYKLLHNLLPRKVAECCRIDSKNKCLMPNHVYNTRSKLIPNLPKNMNKSYQNCY